MGAQLRESKKTLKRVGNLSYVQGKNVPTRVDEEDGGTVHSKVLSEIEESTPSRR